MILSLISPDLQQTPLMVFMNLMIVLVFYLATKKSLVYPYKISRYKRNFAISLLFIFVVFSFWGTDWFHYLRIYPTLLDDYNGIHMETVYVWIAQNLSIGYLSFRLIIWGAALCLFLLTIKRLTIKRDIALCMFGAFALIWFSYARVSLAMIMVYYGVTLLYRPYRIKFLSRILGLALMGCSLFFHKSAAFALFVSMLSFLAEKVNRKLFIALLIFVIPLLVIMIRTFLSDFMQIDSTGGNSIFDQAVVTGQEYMTIDDGEARSLGSMLQVISERVPYYLLAYLCFKCHGKLFFKRIPKDMVFFIRLLFFMVLISSIFLIDFGLNTSTLYGRFLRFAAMPAIIVLAFLWEHKIYPSITKWTFRMAFVGTLYAIAFSIYAAHVAILKGIVL